MNMRANFFAIASVCLLILGLLSVSAQAQAPPPPDPQLPLETAPSGLESQTHSTDTVSDGENPTGPGPQLSSGMGFDPDWQVYTHANTGKVRFLSTRSGRAIQQPSPLAPGTTPDTAARRFLSEYGGMFGLRDAALELKVMKESSIEAESASTGRRSFVRYQQVYEDIPVLGGELIVQMDADLNVVSVSGELLPDLALDTRPQIDAQTARQKALQVVVDAYAKEYGLTLDDLQAADPQLWIYNPILLGGPGLREDTLVWRFEITSSELLPIRELALVDAGRGFVKLNFNQIDASRYRVIYNNQNNSTYGLPGNGPVREEGDPATGVGDADDAYDYAGFTYNFYSSRYGRDSLDGKGMELVATTRYCPNSTDCPYYNAFWNGMQVVFGQNYTADDVVAHEMTHGVTEHESRLFYYMQSGAINEAFSDIWGEFVDLSYTNGHDDDSAGVAWLHGEDLSGGDNRSLIDPPDHGDPDRMSSGFYYCGSSDNGGVHTNSGVGNKAAYLMTEGGTFNGYTISGIGLEKAARIWYRVQTALLTSAADYQDLGLALNQSCNDQIGTAGITSWDCQQVREVIAATEMLEQPSCPATHAPLCDNYGFDSQFNGSSTGWGSQSGAWYSGATYLYTEGVEGNWASVANLNAFSDFDYEVRMRREGTTHSNGVIVRGDPYPLRNNMQWKTGYAFYYTTDGQFSVWRLDEEAIIALQNWIPSEAILTADAWNKLRVVAEGPNLSYYINDHLVWSGWDSTYSRGRAGVQMYRLSGTSGQELQVDWAVLKGGSPSYLFYDNLENPVSGNWYTYALSGENYWYYPQSNNPFGDHSFLTNPEYTTSGVYNFWGYDAAAVGDYYVRMTKNIPLPVSKTAYLHFNHAYDFYSNRSGGVVEYTINNGASYNDAGSLFTHNGYTGSIAIGYSNPLEGSSAFVTDSDGMISSRLNLNTLAGETVRFRFRIGSAAYEDLGWLIDDVLIYTCEPQMMHVHLPLVMNSGASSASAFHSSFNGSANNWQTHSGVWTVNPIYYSTPGISSASVSASYQQNFTDFTYEARMKRIGSQSNANSIMIRGTPLPLVGGNYWNSYYSFQYSADGRYSVYKRVGGASSTALQAWTASPAIKTGDSWNVLKVIAYDSSLYFYINGVLVWHDTDSDLTSGRIGLGMYMSGSAWNRLDVDWVSLTPQGSSYKPDGEISPEQRALNEAAALGGSEDQAP